MPETSELMGSRPNLVVGIGASAGGLKALEQFFEGMPQDSGAAFVVIQHLSPDFKSLMNELLGRRTDMGVNKVADGMVLAPNTIYLIPPGKNLIIEDYHLRLLDQDRGSGSPLNLPIDIFFQSLAKECIEHAIGVVLSGTGSDGTRGLQDIHQAGGLSLVQAPETAEFDGMPQSAINAGIVDQTASPSELAQVIYQFSQSPIDADQFRAETSLLRSGPQKLQKIIAILAAEQFDFSHYKPNTIGRRIHRRCVIAGFSDLDDYIQHLRDSPAEQALLRTNLLISVTRFFRDSDAWDFLEQKIIPQLIDQTADEDSLRIWVTACATGEEAYSMAILAHEAIQRSQRSINVKIFATDVDTHALEKAAQGIYPKSIANDLSRERLKNYFNYKDQSETFEVKRSLREMLIFAPQNLDKDAGFTRMNLVSCRNVLIYLQPDLQLRVLRNLHFSLTAQGYLFLGESETLGDLQEEFETLEQRHKIYQKRRNIRLPVNVRGSGPLLTPISRYVGPSSSATRLDPILNDAFKSFLVEGKTSCFIVDPEHQLLHNCGDPLHILQLPDGPMTQDLTKMMPIALRLPLSTALHRAQRNRETVHYTGVQIANEETVQTLNLRVTYKHSSKLGNAFMIVVLSMAEPALPRADSETYSTDTAVTQRVLQLEHELQQTRENLQATIEELEATNEEQQATNEELVASNEELQSTNEELHAVNEELFTVNAEYQSKIHELTELNNDIDNLLKSIDIGVIFLDKDLKIRKFTPAATEYLNLMETDVGRPLSHFSHNLDCPHVQDLLKQVLTRDESMEREVNIQGGGAPLLMRIQPYHVQNQAVQGIIITLVNIATIKQAQILLRKEVQERLRAEAALKTLNNTLEQRVQEQTNELVMANRQLFQEITERKQLQTELDQFFQLPLHLMCITDDEGTFQRLNPSFEKVLGYSAEEIMSQPFTALIHPDDLAATQATIEQQMDGVTYFENRYRCQDGSYKWLAWSSHPTKQRRLYATAVDITELKQAQADLNQKNAELDAIFRALPDAVIFHDADHQIQMVNPAFQDLFGYQPCDIYAESSQRLYANPDDYEAQKKEQSNITLETPLKFQEVQYRCQDGNIFPAETVNTIVHDSTGAVLGSLRMVRDMRDRKAIQRSLRHQNIAIESATVGIAMLEEGKFIYINKAHAHLFGFSSPQALIGKPWQLLYDDARINLIEQDIFPKLQQDRSWKGEVKAKHQNGSLFDEEIALSLTEDGTLIRICQDITERKQVENQQQSLVEALKLSNRDLEQFAYVASHDLREPLRKVKSFSELLGQRYLEQLDESGQQYLSYVTGGVDRMEALIQDLLVYSRWNHETKTLVSVDLNTTLETVQQDLDLLIEENQVTVTHTELPTVTANATAMQQLFLNLISNAIKFHGDRPPTIHIAAQRMQQEWLISVADNGIGIDSKFCDRIFVIFQRLHSRKDYPGTGIGLALCRKIVENLGGRIWAESQSGQGSTFYFTLPLDVVPWGL